MDIEQIREWALALEDVTEGFPFGETVLVFKAGGKMFLLLPLDEIPLQFNVKCEPELALSLREEYPDTIMPGYHMNKRHWNTVVIDGRLSASKLKEMIMHSHSLVYKKRK